MTHDLSTHSPESKNPAPIEFRTAEPSDGPRLWRLVRSIPILDDNSLYAYLLMCSHFGRSAVVAEMEGELVGFVGGYVRPDKPDTAFVWQVAVAPAARGRGLASDMLDAFIATPGNQGASYLEATVTPSNAPSRRLFESFARRQGAPCVVGEGFPEPLFAGTDHEGEELFRIGPIHSASA